MIAPLSLAPGVTLLLVALCSSCSDVEHPVITLSPTEETRDLVEDAAAQWTAATGIELRVGEGGIPIKAAPRALDDEGREACATTEIVREFGTHRFRSIKELVIARTPPRGCPNWETGRATLHELGHILCNWHVDGWPANACHSDAGLMAAVVNATNYPDARSLETVCTYAACTRMEAAE